MESRDVFLATCSDTGIGAGVFVDEGDDGTVEVDGEVGELGGAVTGGRTEDSRVDELVVPAAGLPGPDGVDGEVRLVGDDGADDPAGVEASGESGGEAGANGEPPGPVDVAPVPGCDGFPGVAELPGRLVLSGDGPLCPGVCGDVLVPVSIGDSSGTDPVGMAVATQVPGSAVTVTPVSGNPTPSALSLVDAVVARTTAPTAAVRVKVNNAFRQGPGVGSGATARRARLARAEDDAALTVVDGGAARFGLTMSGRPRAAYVVIPRTRCRR